MSRRKTSPLKLNFKGKILSPNRGSPTKVILSLPKKRKTRKRKLSDTKLSVPVRQGKEKKPKNYSPYDDNLASPTLHPVQSPVFDSTGNRMLSCESLWKYVALRFSASPNESNRLPQLPPEVPSSADSVTRVLRESRRRKKRKLRRQNKLIEREIERERMREKAKQFVIDVALNSELPPPGPHCKACRGRHVAHTCNRRKIPMKPAMFEKMRLKMNENELKKKETKMTPLNLDGLNNLSDVSISDHDSDNFVDGDVDFDAYETLLWVPPLGKDYIERWHDEEVERVKQEKKDGVDRVDDAQLRAAAAATAKSILRATVSRSSTQRKSDLAGGRHAICASFTAEIYEKNANKGKNINVETRKESLEEEGDHQHHRGLLFSSYCPFSKDEEINVKSSSMPHRMSRQKSRSSSRSMTDVFSVSITPSNFSLNSSDSDSSSDALDEVFGRNWKHQISNDTIRTTSLAFGRDGSCSVNPPKNARLLSVGENGSNNELLSRLKIKSRTNSNYKRLMMNDNNKNGQIEYDIMNSDDLSDRREDDLICAELWCLRRRHQLLHAQNEQRRQILSKKVEAERERMRSHSLYNNMDVEKITNDFRSFVANESSNRKEESRLEREKREREASRETREKMVALQKCKKILRKECVRHREFLRVLREDFLHYRRHWQLEYLTTNDIYVERDLHAYLQTKATESEMLESNKAAVDLATELCVREIVEGDKNVMKYMSTDDKSIEKLKKAKLRFSCHEKELISSQKVIREKNLYEMKKLEERSRKIMSLIPKESDELHLNLDSMDRNIFKMGISAAQLLKSRDLRKFTDTNLRNSVEIALRMCKESSDKSAYYCGYHFTSHAAHAMLSAMDKAKATCKNFSENDNLFCLCRQPYEEEKLYVGCDTCDDWFHAECIGLDENLGEKIESYCCFNCTRQGLGATRFKGEVSKEKWTSTEKSDSSSSSNSSSSSDGGTGDDDDDDDDDGRKAMSSSSSITGKEEKRHHPSLKLVLKKKK
eukprot:g6249.t1